MADANLTLEDVSLKGATRMQTLRAAFGSSRMMVSWVVAGLLVKAMESAATGRACRSIRRHLGLRAWLVNMSTGLGTVRARQAYQCSPTCRSGNDFAGRMFVVGLTMSVIALDSASADVDASSAQPRPTNWRQIAADQALPLVERLDALKTLARDADDRHEWRQVQNLFVELLLEQAVDEDASQLIRDRFLSEFKMRKGYVGAAIAYVERELATEDDVARRAVLLALRDQSHRLTQVLRNGTVRSPMSGGGVGHVDADTAAGRDVARRRALDRLEGRLANALRVIVSPTAVDTADGLRGLAEAGAPSAGERRRAALDAMHERLGNAVPGLSARPRTVDGDRIAVLAASAASATRNAAIDSILLQHLYETTDQLIREHRYEEAQEACLSAAGSAPDTELAAASLRLLLDIVIRESSDDLDTASDAYLDIVAKHEQHLPSAELCVARARYEHGDVEIAKNQFTSWLDSYPSHGWRSEGLMGRALCEIALKEYDSGLRTLEKVVANKPAGRRSSEAQFLIAWVHLSNEKINEAILALQKVVTDYPDTADATRAEELLLRLDP